jgi:hypothetical protein
MIYLPLIIIQAAASSQPVLGVGEAIWLRLFSWFQGGVQSNHFASRISEKSLPAVPGISVLEVTIFPPSDSAFAREASMSSVPM